MHARTHTHTHIHTQSGVCAKGELIAFLFPSASVGVAGSSDCARSFYLFVCDLNFDLEWYEPRTELLLLLSSTTVLARSWLLQVY